MSADRDPIPFHRPSLGAGEREAVLQVLDSGWLTTGSRTAAFETAFLGHVSFAVGNIFGALFHNVTLASLAPTPDNCAGTAQWHRQLYRASRNFALVADLNGVSRTLSARYYKDGSEILIAQRGRNPRRLTLVEAARLMGYGDIVGSRADIPVSDTQAYRQFGNSVVPLVVEAVGRQVVKVMQGHGLASAPLASPNSKRSRQKTAAPSAVQMQRMLFLSQ